MAQKRETKAINKLCVREILSLSFVCGAGKARMRTAFLTRVTL